MTLHSTAAPNGIDFTKNPDLQGLMSLQVMDAVIDYAGQQDMRVILDHHRSGFGTGTSGTRTLVRRPVHRGRLGPGLGDAGRALSGQSDRDRGGSAQRAVQRDLGRAVVPRTGRGPPSGPATPRWRPIPTCWSSSRESPTTRAKAIGGEAISQASKTSIVLNVANRVVYSPHDYPNSVYPQPQFQATDFGPALPAKFRQMWGYIYENNVAPVYIGEFGTKLQDPKDTVWFEAITPTSPAIWTTTAPSTSRPGPRT